ncbi:MAG TPA: M64 family metallopeptidase [Bdellovibrionales bacterium]|nr:M64 family metallopeptidase [Bdellovibrionales bacterium]
MTFKRIQHFVLLIVASVTALAGAAAQAETMRANIVDERGRIVGQKSIRDLSLCGSDLGPRLIAEGHLNEIGRLHLDCSSRFEPFQGAGQSWPGAEVVTLVNQGPSQNRIDLTIVGDGYTAAQKAKFFDDAKKITQDLFGQDTFATYLPLFNVHAVFVPSAESGIGDGRPKNTALKLYRHPTTRQAVMPGSPYDAERASRLAPDVDYPILVANDPFYGGLGGQFAITTSAPLNLTTVLRHELGHNFGRVGEEYDGGQVYSGANHSRSAQVPWMHWVRGQLQVHKAELLYYVAPWQNLGKAPLEVGVRVPQGFRRLFIDFSSLGMDSKEDVALFVNGQRIAFDGNFNYDRNFYRVELPVQAGEQRLVFQELKKDGNNIISKVALYALPDGFPMDTPLTGAFATYNQGNQMVGYRPTESFCLMRDMKSHKFCSVCLENMWRNFLREISLIDGIAQSGSVIEAKVLPLGNRIAVRWVDPRGQVREKLNNVLKWEAAAGDKGRWTMQAAFVSNEVADPQAASWAIHNKTIDVQ